MARSVQRGVNRGIRTKTVVLPAPVGGLNGRDSITQMPITDAIALDNWFATANGLKARKGTTVHRTVHTSAIVTVMTYAGGASQKLLAFSNNSVYDITAAGVGMPAALISGRGNNRAIGFMFSNAGAQYLVMVTGADPLSTFDGTTFTEQVVTGLTGSADTVSYVHPFQGRLLLAQTAQLGFYYLGLGSISGAATYFDLSQVAKRGGHLMSIGSFSRDGGSGPADYCVFATSMGEYLVYAGTDPSNAATWALVGRYYASPPITRKCFHNFSGDLLVWTYDGLIAISEIMKDGQQANQENAITSKLGRLITEYNQYAANPQYWQIASFPRESMLIVNAPAGAAGADGSVTFVMNTKTGAWTRFTGWNAMSFALMDENLYMGCLLGDVLMYSNSDVSGDRDLTGNITLTMQQAYSDFEDGDGVGGVSKQFQFATATFLTGGTLTGVTFDLIADYEAASAGSMTVANVKGQVQTLARSVGKVGLVGSVYMTTVKPVTDTVALVSTRVTFAPLKAQVT